MLLHRSRRLEAVQIVVMVAVAQRGAVRERPDHVVLHIFFADAAGDGIHVHEIRVLEFGHFRREKQIQPLDKVQQIADIVARLKPAERILLRHHEAQHERQQLVLGVQADDVREVAREIILRLLQKFLVPRRVIRQLKIGVAENRAQRDVNDLKIILRRLRGRNFRQRVKIVQQNKIAFELRVDHRRDVGERLRKTAAHDQKAPSGIGCHLKIHRRAVAGTVVLGE